MATTYRCIRDCYFNDRFHHAGREYTFSDELKVPHHFALKGSKEAEVVEAEQKAAAEAAQAGPSTMHEIARTQGRVAEPAKPKKAPGKPAKAEAKE